MLSMRKPIVDGEFGGGNCKGNKIGGTAARNGETRENLLLVYITHKMLGERASPRYINLCPYLDCNT